MLHPETYKTTGLTIPVANFPISIWAIQWLTPMIGMLNITERVLATIQPTVKGPPIPGPFV